MEHYIYTGPVYEFDRCIDQNWHASTYAVSKKKALSNLVYQYKKGHNRTPSAKITLSEDRITVQGKEK